jgi:hypothetical protein
MTRPRSVATGLALGLLAAAWIASDRIALDRLGPMSHSLIPWPFVAAGLVVGFGLTAAYLVWLGPSGRPNKERDATLPIGAAGGPMPSAVLQAALSRMSVRDRRVFVVGLGVGSPVVAAINPWASGQARGPT